MEYPVLDVTKIKEVTGSRLLILWEEANDNLLGGLLKRPDSQKGRQYTGVILKKGPYVDSFSNGIFVRRSEIECALKDETERELLESKIKHMNSIEREFKIGQRVMFEQFSGFEKYQSADGKERYAFVEANACWAILPLRTKVRSEEWTQFGEDE